MLPQAPAHGVEVGLLRSDYMVDAPTGKLLQVEVNTIAASFACLSALTGTRTSDAVFGAGELTPSSPSGWLHRHQVKRAGLERLYPPAAMPENHALEGMAGGLAAAWREVRPHSPQSCGCQPNCCCLQVALADGVVVMIVQPGERNVFDQQWIQARSLCCEGACSTDCSCSPLQSTLWNAHGIKTVRRTLADVAAMGKIEADGKLRIGSDLVSVVYFRAGCVL